MTPQEVLDTIHGPAGFDLQSECTGGWLHAPAPDARSDAIRYDTCWHAMADGWIGLGELCPACLRTLREAMDAVVPGLVWCERYREQP